MEIGFNDDVAYRGSTFHIQTEDHGIEDGRVSSQLFISGRILESTTVEYKQLLDEIADEEERKAKIRKVMVASHRNLYKKLFSGALDEKAGIDPEAPAAEELDTAEDFEPTQSRVPEPAARVMEQDGKVTFTFDDGQEMNLAALADQLNSVNVMPHGGVVDAAKGGEMFDDLGVDLDSGDSAPPPAVTTPVRPHEVTAEMDAPVFPAPPRTGRLAFQGLLEPPAGADIIALVTQFLASR